ncbi:MAG: class I adenylate-forming enzyme family protein [Ilumatobacteraceae bacterium]
MATHPLGPTVDGLLAERATTHPDTVFLRFATGDLTFADTNDRVDRLAARLRATGVERGDVVPVLLPNSVEFALTWLALCRLGAVACLVNTSFKGPALHHALAVAAPVTVVVHDAFAAAVDAVAADLPTLQRLVRLQDGAWEGLAAATTDGPPPPSHGPTDPAMILFTSGTTGPSKGCVLSHRYTVRQAG